ncbi:hypothetical protein BKP35_02910 [Anaerobacillus arseniciselenatis]|uniref:Fluoride-specific ion channel FluC n=2 Tax=Anaerobacillus arseniciselenatis TaxID=85682 RepID=A0A1S2LUU3_9BACI|nr:hypothetical protein BKP35_02910 [Anaerobacillus arseniciselenatis]
MTKKLYLTLIAIAIGGALGTLFRYAINLQTLTLLFPLGTALENLVGSLLLGILTGFVIHVKLNEVLKTGLGVGFCGGFSTMSTLAADFYYLLVAELWLLLFTYLFISVIGGVLLAFLGFMIGEKGGAKYQLSRRVGEG